MLLSVLPVSVHQLMPLISKVAASTSSSASVHCVIRRIGMTLVPKAQEEVLSEIGLTYITDPPWLNHCSPRITLAWLAVSAQSLQLEMEPAFLDPQTEMRAVGKMEMEN